MPHVDTRFHRSARRLVAAGTAALLGVLTLSLTAVPAQAEPFGSTTPADPVTVTADALPTWQIDGVVWSQVVVGNTVYVTGSFSKARPPGVAVGGAGEVPANNIFAYDIRTGDRVAFDHSLNAQGLVVRANPAGTRLYVGGDFTTVDGQSRQHVAAFDVATGALVPGFAPTTDGQVRGIAVAESAVQDVVYIGGNFRSANGQGRLMLAKLDQAARLDPAWRADADGGYVWSMVLTPDKSRLIVGGSFTTINGTNAYGMGAVSAATGATGAWAANARLRTAGAYGAITALSTDGTQIYGSGYSYGAGAEFEGTFAADPTTGEVNWVNDCLGDTYDIFPIGQVAYNVSHRHDCSAIGGFPDTVPRTRWIKASADRTFPIGTIATKDAYNWDFTGLPYSGSLNWYPDLEFGAVTASRQAAWTVAGTNDYVVLGGEFPSVNGVSQQGLVRFAKRPIAPAKMKPVYNAAFTPVAYPTDAGRVKVTFTSLWDRDDTTMTYEVYRSPGIKIGTFTRNDAQFWKLPALSFIDTGVAPGTSVRYQTRATDPDGNTQWSAWSPYVTTSSTATPALTQAVRDAGATHYWRLNEPAGSQQLDDVGDLIGTPVSVTAGIANSVSGTAVTSAGGATPKITTADLDKVGDAVTVQAWVKTTSVRGGRIVGLGDSAAGTSSSGNTDRVLYLDNSGRVNFAVNNGAYRTLTSRTAVNDGQWHQLSGVSGPDGLELFVDGVRVGRLQGAITPKAATGYWRIGADQTTGFVNRPTDAGLAASIDEVAVYPTALSQAVIQAGYTASGRTGSWGAAPTDAYGSAVSQGGPDIYWRLDEASGVAQDSAGSGVRGDVLGTVTRNVAGAFSGSTAGAFNGSNGLIVAQQSWSAPKSYSAELWFKTTTTRGGKLIGYGNATTGLSTTYDRHVVMQNNGRLSFGAFAGTQVSLVSDGAYNDGQWHHLVASQGAEGMRLWVDTNLVGSNSVTGADETSGYWRVGGDKTWGGTTSNYLAATIDEVAVYPRAITEQELRDHYTQSGRTAVNRPPTAAFSSEAVHLAVSLDASKSADLDGAITGYAWDFGDGSTGTGEKPKHSYAAAGTYAVKLTVTDGGGLTSTVTVPVTVVANQAPAAAFDLTAEHLAVEFDAAASSDADGTIESYAWNFGDGTTGTGKTAEHSYSQPGTYTVRLTVTDDDGATSPVATRSVTVTPAPNELPTAAFTATADLLKVVVDASDATDADGTVESYDWDFGDGSTGTGETAEHTYAAAGTYTVTLTVTDDAGDEDSTTKEVTVSANQAPTAEFTSEVEGLTASFAAGGSADADGTIEDYSWDFGDDHDGDGTTPEHTYAEAGTFTVTLTVTDDRGATTKVSHAVTVAAPSILASDSFERTVASGWGSADRGGAWKISTGASRFSVVGGVGKASLNAGNGYIASLPISSAETDTAVTVSINKVATGGGQYVSLVGRQIDLRNDYRAKYRIAANGAVTVYLVKIVDGVETVMSTSTIAGLTDNPGDRLNLRVQVFGSGPTTIRAKAWKGATEPTSWAATTTDGTSALQVAGGVAVAPYLSGSTTDTPVEFAFDDLRVVPKV